MVGLRLAFHLLGLVHLGGTVTTAQSLQLAQDILETGDRVVILTGLYRCRSAKTNVEGQVRPYHLRGEVRDTRLADLATRQPDFSHHKEKERRKDLLRGLPKKGMEEVCSPEGTSNDWWNPAIGGLDIH